MAYKDILVTLDPAPDADARVKFAIGLARTHGARLIGLDATSDAAFQGQWREQALQVGRYFEETAEGAGVEAKLVGADYRRGGPSPNLSHCVDLIIAPSPGQEARSLIASFVPDELLLKSGTPTLLLPAGWPFGPVGESVVIAWNASREATRAVHDTMPFLKTAKKVVVFSFSSHPSDLRINAHALVDHLSRHGVDAIVSDWTNTGDITAVEALFASLDTQDSDLIVAGGFGHSRAFEGLFGGVSLDLMRQPTLPVLLSH
jgi:nucleotide-binding universal stress UspA family protein